MYEQVVSFFEAHKKILLTILIYIVCFSITFLAGYNIGIRKGVSDNGATVKQLRDELAKSAEQQHKLTEALERSQRTAADIAAGVDNSQKLNTRTGQAVDNASTASEAVGTGITNAQSSVGETGKYLDECQRIVREVRKAGTAQVQSN